MQIISMSAMALNIVDTAEASTVLLFFANMAVAMSDVVLDSLMIV